VQNLGEILSPVVSSLSDHIARNREASQQINHPRSLPATRVARVRPDADVIVVAHAGLDNIVSVGDVWRNLPIDQLIGARWWRLPRDAVPWTATHDAQVQWLYDW